MTITTIPAHAPWCADPRQGHAPGWCTSAPVAIGDVEIARAHMDDTGRVAVVVTSDVAMLGLDDLSAVIAELTDLRQALAAENRSGK